MYETVNQKIFTRRHGAGVIQQPDFDGARASAGKKTSADHSVHVTVNVHSSDVGVSPEVLEETVDKLLEGSHVEVVKSGADASVIELKIDIFKKDHGFKIDCDWDTDPTPEAEEHCDAQDEIDDIVEKEVHQFIEFLHQ